MQTSIHIRNDAGYVTLWTHDSNTPRAVLRALAHCYDNGGLAEGEDVDISITFVEDEDVTSGPGFGAQ